MKAATEVASNNELLVASSSSSTTEAPNSAKGGKKDSRGASLSSISCTEALNSAEGGKKDSHEASFSSNADEEKKSKKKHSRGSSSSTSSSSSSAPSTSSSSSSSSVPSTSSSSDPTLATSDVTSAKGKSSSGLSQKGKTKRGSKSDKLKKLIEKYPQFHTTTTTAENPKPPPSAQSANHAKRLLQIHQQRSAAGNDFDNEDDFNNYSNPFISSQYCTFIQKKICALCGYICGNAKKLGISSGTIATHLNSTECRALQKNVPYTEVFKCKYCDVTISQCKSFNTKIVTHLAKIHDGSFSCVYCEEDHKITNMFSHIVDTHVWSASNSINCKKCRQSLSAKNFFLHLTEFHNIDQPNIYSIRSHIPEKFPSRPLAILAVLLSKYIN